MFLDEICSSCNFTTIPVGFFLGYDWKGFRCASKTYVFSVHTLVKVILVHLSEWVFMEPIFVLG